MIESPAVRARAVRQLLLIASLMGLGYLCVRTLRFSSAGLNLAFQCGFLTLPFLAVRPVEQLHKGLKVLTTILLLPLLVIAAFALLVTVSCDIPAQLEHRVLSRELSRIQQGNYSVYLVRETTAGGAVGPHGVGLEQRMFIVPGLYLVKYLDYFEGTREGSLSAVGEDKVRLHIPNSISNQEVDKVYSLKRRVYF